VSELFILNDIESEIEPNRDR